MASQVFGTIADRPLTDPAFQDDAAWYDDLQRVFSSLLLAKTYVAGDLLYGGAPTNLTTLPIGAPGEVLQVAANTIPEWTLALTGDYVFTGDLIFNGSLKIDTWAEGSIGYTNAGSILTELPLGTNVPPQVLGVNAPETAPAWQTASTYLAHAFLSPTHTDTLPSAPVVGQMIVADASPAWAAFVPGVVGAPLVINPAGAPAWVVPGPLPGAILHHNGTDTVFTTTMAYTDATRTVQFSGGNASLFGAVGSSLFIGNTPAEPMLDVSLTAVARLMELIPTSRVITDSRSGWVVMPSSSIITMDVLNGSIGGVLALDGTFEFRQAGSGFGAGNLFRNSGMFKNENAVVASWGSQYTFVNTAVYQADAAAISSLFVRNILHQPTFNVINAGTLGVTIGNCAYSNPTVGAGVTMAQHRDFEMGPGSVAGVLTIRDGLHAPAAIAGTNVNVVRSLLNVAAGRFFLNHTGTAPSQFGGDVRMLDGVSTLYGTTNGVGIARLGVASIRMLGFGGVNNEGLDWDFDNPDNVAITSSTSAGLNFDLLEIAFGPSTVADGTNNWVFAFAPALRATQLAGDYSEVLFSSAAAIAIAHALSNFATWTINAPTAVLVGGSVVNAANVIVQTNMAVGTNRYGVLITSNPTGGTINEALRVVNGRTRVANFFHEGTLFGIFGVTPVTQPPAYTPTNVTPTRTFDADATTVHELADVLGTFIADTQTWGGVG